MKRIITICTVTAFLIQNSFGWGVTGHQTVGRVAAALLTPDAQAMVASKLHVTNTPAAVSDALAAAAEWPDAVARSKYKASVPYHFIDLGVKPGTGDQAQWDSQTTAFSKLVAYYQALTTGGMDEFEDGSNLKFIAHLIGDIHQPLHTTTDQDRGGNCVQVKLTFKSGKPSAANKFHTEFDDTLVETPLGKSDKTIAPMLVSQWNAMSPSDQSAMIGDPFAGDAATTFRAWVLEGHQLAVTNLYPNLSPAVPSLETKEVKSNCSDAAAFTKGKTYSLSFTETQDEEMLVKQQLIKAGVRLAAVLNQAAQTLPH